VTDLVTSREVDREVDERELEIERLTRLYVALTQINQAIVRTRTRDALFQQVCEVLVVHGGFRLAWIGWHEARTHRLVPVAQAGDENGYLQSIQVYADDRPEGRGPTGTAFREGRPYVCNDLLTDPATLPWRSELERRGLRASAALPIRCAGAVCGTLTVYAERRGFYREKELALLTEAADDLSFALDNLEREEARRGADEVVKRFVAIVESTDDAIISKTPEETITSWNPAAESMFGYRADEIVGRSIALLVPADRADEAPMILRQIRSGAHVKELETLRVGKDGTRIPVSITFSPIWGPDETAAGGQTIVGVSEIVRDISDRKRTEAVAERAQRFANTLIETMPGVFYLYDEQGRFLRWNRNFQDVSGYTEDEIGRMHPLDFFSVDERALVKRRIAEVFARGESSVEAAFVAKGGSTTPYFFTGKRIQFDGATCLVGVGVDIAERKRAEAALSKSETRYRTTLDNILEGCQLIGFDWRYLYLNGAAATHNRRPNVELLGQRMQDAWPGIETTDVFALLRRCMTERIALHEETEFPFPDGTSGWFDVRAQPVPEGIFVLSIDISERKRAEAALRELNESLERKVAERTRELDVARARAEAADQLKSAFLATMSHELRTPLNSIIGFTGIVLQGLAGPLNGEQSKQLGMVQGSARHLLELINDVLDISKIEAGQLEVRPAPFDLRASIERVTASVGAHAERKGLSVRVVAPPTLETMESDRRRVEQILLNLLNNAIKFTDVGGVSLTVEVVALALAGAGAPRPVVRIEVADTGIGMAHEDLAKLFQPFRQIDSGLQRQHEGTGLGLAICRRLTGLLGGTIRAESTLGQGSRFTVALPLRWM
jgi:PAS domain S-box-containing protein